MNSTAVITCLEVCQESPKGSEIIADNRRTTGTKSDIACIPELAKI